MSWRINTIVIKLNTWSDVDAKHRVSICKCLICKKNIHKNKARFYDEIVEVKVTTVTGIILCGSISLKIFRRARAKGGRDANSRISRWERDRENGDIYGEESLGIFVELNTLVNLETPHLCHAHVIWYPETDFELLVWNLSLKDDKFNFFFKWYYMAFILTSIDIYYIYWNKIRHQLPSSEIFEREFCVYVWYKKLSLS